MALPQIQPATAGSTGANTERVNAAWVQGVGPGYWPTKGTGLTLNLTSGIAFNLASGVLYTYAAATLAMTNATTNYVFLDPTASYIPAVNTTGFPTGCLPIATVITAAGVITNIDDNRTWFIVGSGSSGGGLNGAAIKTGDYPIVSGDNGKMLVMNSGGAHIFTLPAAPPSGTFCVLLTSIGTGATTVDRNGLTIDNVAGNLTLQQFDSVFIWTDGANWFTDRGLTVVRSVAGRTGDVVLAESDIAGLVLDLATLASAIATKADKVSIAGATKTKITYNTQGIVTAGADATPADVGALPTIVRSTVTLDAGTLASGAQATGSVSLAKLGALIKVVSVAKSWLRIYSTAAGQSADSARAYGTQPVQGCGLLFEIAWIPATTTPLSYPTFGAVALMNDDGSWASTLYWTATNLEAGSTHLTYDLTLAVIVA